MFLRIYKFLAIFHYFIEGYQLIYINSYRLFSLYLHSEFLEYQNVYKSLLL
jgi:hypothetical protein